MGMADLIQKKKRQDSLGHPGGQGPEKGHEVMKKRKTMEKKWKK